MKLFQYFLLLFLGFSLALSGYVKTWPEEEEPAQESALEKDDEIADRESKERDYYNLYYKNRRRVENKRERYRYYQSPSQETYYNPGGWESYAPYSGDSPSYYPYP